MAILVHTHPLRPAEFADALRRAAPDIAVHTDADAAPSDDVEAVLAWRLKPGVAPRWPNLRVLCSIGAGAEKLLVDDLPAKVAVTRIVDPQQAQSMAQYVVATTLAHLRELPRYREQQAVADWTRHRQRPLDRSRVGILGQGAIAQAIACAMRTLGLPVATWGRSLRPIAALDGVERHAGDDGLTALLARSAVLVCTLPLTDATRGLLDRATLSRLPAGAYLVNVGRGEHVVEDDLLALLDDGHLAGAALDVFRREPLPAEHWAWRHPKVVATPHVAGEADVDLVAAQCVEALRAARAGAPVPRAIDRAAGY